MSDLIRAPITDTPRIKRVEVEPHEYGFSVSPVWADVDRPNTGGWVVRTRPLAERLAAAVRAGVAISDPEIRTDVNGQTFVSARHLVRARAANADLKRLGF